MSVFPIRRVLSHDRGVAAAEMALVAPILIFLLFGMVEIGNLFYNQHILAKAVRDGARYAARQPFADYNMGACTMSADAVTRVRRLVRTAQLAAAGSDARVPNWAEADEASTISVSVDCDNSGTYGGIYANNANVAAAVTVQATVPYSPLIGSIAFSTTGINLSARSQAAVAGL
jgi:Flp pilus assembly protein TadG